MATASSPTTLRKHAFQLRYFMWAGFGLMSLLVFLTRDRTLLDSNSFLRQRYAPFPLLMFAHGIPGALALLLGPFQFSSRLRKRFVKVHRVMGRIYVGGTLIAAPMAVAVAVALPIPGLFMATIIHSTCWVVTTATALYCILTGRVQQHREWMMRSYPFAAVFIGTRAIGQVPAIARMGIPGNVSVVWSVLAVACFLPSFVIAWKALAGSKRSVKPRSAAIAS